VWPWQNHGGQFQQGINFAGRGQSLNAGIQIIYVIRQDVGEQFLYLFGGFVG